MNCGSQLRAKDESGQVLAIVTVFMVVLIGITGFALDVGHAYLVQRQLQAATDAAALAGALDLPDSTLAKQTARNYGPEPGKLNVPRANDVSTIDSGYPETKCVEKIVTGCTKTNGQVNTITVRSTSVVKTIFAKIVGVDSFNVHATSTACSPCSVKPLDIMLVLDRTGSMCQKSDGSNDPACQDLAFARDGMKAFMAEMDPRFDEVGLAVFPPATTPSSRCSAVPSSNNYNYNLSSAAYLISPMSFDYTSINAALAPSCIKGGGNTAYGKAIDEAQKELDAVPKRPGVQSVIVLLSDGAANTGNTTLGKSSPYNAQPCHQGIWSSDAAEKKGTLVYAIGYDLNGAGTDYEKCHPSWWNKATDGNNGVLESPAITAWQAMGGQQGFPGIASSYDTFYNKPDPGELKTIFRKIAQDIFRTAQLIDDTLT